MVEAGNKSGLQEIYQPSDSIIQAANIKEYNKTYERSIKEREAFWAEMAGSLSWYKKWDKVLDGSNHPFYKWFVGGRINIVHNAIDRHLTTHRKNKLAIIWEGEPGDERTFSYYALNREVGKFANVLKSMGVKKGEVVTIYLPLVPELVFAMLACAKIGAMHSVVYGGGSAPKPSPSASPTPTAGCSSPPTAASAAASPPA